MDAAIFNRQFCIHWSDFDGSGFVFLAEKSERHGGLSFGVLSFDMLIIPGMLGGSGDRNPVMKVNLGT